MIELRKELSSDERGNRSSRRKPLSDIEIDWDSIQLVSIAELGGAVDKPLHHQISHPSKYIHVLHPLRRAELYLT